MSKEDRRYSMPDGPARRNKVHPIFQPLIDAISGVESAARELKPITTRAKVTCFICGGDGILYVNDAPVDEPCPNCDGTGETDALPDEEDRRHSMPDGPEAGNDGYKIDWDHDPEFCDIEDCEEPGCVAWRAEGAYRVQKALMEGEWDAKK